MTDSSNHPFEGFTNEILETLVTPGITERWTAVQTHLHPVLIALVEQIRVEGMRRFPREWPLYEVSFKHQRFVMRDGKRAPIDEYHFVLDRPPRGTGIYVAVSSAEQLILITLQLSRKRKSDLRTVWQAGRVIWQSLIERTTEVRFANEPSVSVELLPATTDETADETPQQAPQTTWLDQYLNSRRASTLLAGFAYRWDDEQITQPAFAQQIIEDVLALFPLNEAVMEQAEALDPRSAALLRERRLNYNQLTLPPIETIVEHIQSRGFTFADAIIRAYHVALQTKPLVILPGISGTGKTRLTRLYADAVYQQTLTQGQDNDHYLIVAVQPDWHNARDLLGYYNAITSTFHPTPFLLFLHRAASDPAMPYFVCLDEMNLARPEYYLAPLLSALETEGHQIDLGAPGGTIECITGEVLPNPFRLPLNIRFTGTVNIDESTYTLSDKLLDRANVIELTDVDLETFRQNYTETIDESAWHIITEVHAILTRAGQPFGYRTVAEMLRYIEKAQGVMPVEQALDQQIKQKMLPKLRGDDTPRLRRALTALLELLLDQPQSAWNKATAIDADTLEQAPYPDSAEKVRRMLERLDADGFTDFYG